LTKNNCTANIEAIQGGDVKTKFSILAVIILNGASAYCGGLSEEDLVNVQEISLEHITGIEIVYRWEKISIHQGDTDALVIKEYMSRDNPRYYADISNTGNKIVVERGRRPIGIFINTFNARAEVFIPKSYMNAISIRTTSGSIEVVDDFICQEITIKSSSGSIGINGIDSGLINITASSGSIRCERLWGNTAVKTKSGNINVGSMEGDMTAETSSGYIKIDRITGSLTASASSGNITGGTAGGDVNIRTKSGTIRCTAGENTGDITLVSSSGNVHVTIPENFSSNFSSRTSSGRLSTPFPEKLFSPISDKKLVQGIIGEGNPAKNINIRTSSGSIMVNWAD
jgi:DUF4097 and DUF4098 domain-containing protein YvlB